MVSAFSYKPLTLYFVSDDKNEISEAVRNRMAELRIKSNREVERRSENSLSYVQLGNLLNGITPWDKAKPETIRGIERALDWRRNHLFDLIHGTGATLKPDSMSGNFVIRIIDVLHSTGTVTGSIEVPVPKEFASADLLAIYPDAQTILGLEQGRGIIFERSAKKPNRIGEVVIVRAAGKILLAYATDLKGAKVKTAQGLELRVEEFLGVLAFEIPRGARDFDAPKGLV